MRYHLLTAPSSNAKTRKSIGVRGCLPFILHLHPGAADICPDASPGCRNACLGHTSGRAGITPRSGSTNPITLARQRRTRLFRSNLPAFLSYLHADIHSAISHASALSLTPCFRLNGTSDIPWELHSIPQSSPSSIFYDYTKSLSRMLASLTSPSWPSNYHLVFSRSESNEDDCRRILSLGGRVACVFSRPPLPSTYLSYPVVDGDAHDLIFLHPPSTILGLIAKKKTCARPVRDRGFFIPVTTGAT